MRYIVLFFTLLVISFSGMTAQTVPVTFHFDPPIEDFDVVRLVGTFNGWNNADDNYRMTDTDGDGEYTITTDLAKNTEHNYKFVLDADWELAFTDPDNPNINLDDNNNSILNVSDPMITYLLPRGITTDDDMYVDTTAEGEPIRAVINHTEGNPIDLDSLRVKIDGDTISNPAQYYDSETNELIYHPSPVLSAEEHTVEVFVESSAGSAIRSSTFERNPGLIVYKTPVDFYFDANNSRYDNALPQSVNSASLVGAFNNWNDQFNPMEDDDGDGVWETTVMFEQGEYQYKFKANGSFWTNDFDYPHFQASGDNNNLIAVNPDSISSIKLEAPAQGSIYKGDDAAFTVKAFLRPGTFGDGIDESSITVKLDGSEVEHSFNPDTSLVQADINLSGEGVHIVEVEFNNNKGIQAKEIYTYGLFAEGTGYHFVDAYEDEVYKYPASEDSGSSDIITVNIQATPQKDSLLFTIQMDKITDRTRLGLLISNPVGGDKVPDPGGADFITEDWNKEGVYASVASPNSSYLNTDKENRFQVMRDPAEYSDESISINEGLLSENKFQFKVGLAFLDSLMEGWIQERDFMLFSYLASETGDGTAFEITESEGGSDVEMEPDLYDAAFIRDAFWQNRIFNNYITDEQPFGPWKTSLDKGGRGIKALQGSDVSDSLASFGPVLTFLTPGVTYWYDTLTVHGKISDSTINTATFYFNEEESQVNVENGHFQKEVVLQEGENTAYFTAVNSEGFSGTSREITLNYEPDYQPEVTIEGSVSGREVTMTATGSSPQDLTLSYQWTEDETNPEELGVSSNSESVNFTVPGTEGEYFVNVQVTDTEERTAFARKLITAENDSVFISGINDHANWIDSAIVYEIYPRSFSEQGGFEGIENKIDYLVDLGINAVWFMPIYEGPTTHGYEITDYKDFEEDYGTKQDFEELVEALHDNGIKVILDFVVNHTSIQHPFMQNVFEYKQYSPWSDFYIWDGVPGESNYSFYFDWVSLPNLNHDNPDVREYFIDVAKHWVMEYDIDGYRCDVAWGVEERNSQFWKDWRKELKNIKPELFLEAEASSAEPVFYQKRFDSANDWELRNRIRETIEGTNDINSLDNELRREYPDYVRPFRFMENHDEVRMASAYDVQRSKLAHTLIMTANGMPLIYSGGEVGELTQRELIDWSDPENIRTYFKRLIAIRHKFIGAPTVEKVSNDNENSVYTFISQSGSDKVVTAANFSENSQTISMDLSGYGDGSDSYYFTNLMDDSYTEIDSDNLGDVSVSMDPFQAKVFYLGDEPVTVNVKDETNKQIPKQYSLSQNYPNPFNPSTNIEYQLPEAGKVSLVVYDILGRKVTTLVNKQQNPGSYKVTFNAENLASGVYIYRLRASNFVKTKKLILLR